VKKGVKRKADTTTPTANSFDPLFPPTESKSAKISTRRESGRQIKKVVTLYFLMLWSSLEHMGGHFKVHEATSWWFLLLWWSSWVVWSHCSLNGRRRTVSRSTRRHYPSCPPAWAARYVNAKLFKFFTKKSSFHLLYESLTVLHLAVGRPDILNHKPACWAAPTSQPSLS
jgi:hypothetical protein